MINNYDENIEEILNKYNQINLNTLETIEEVEDESEEFGYHVSSRTQYILNKAKSIQERNDEFSRLITSGTNLLQ